MSVCATEQERCVVLAHGGLSGHWQNPAEGGTADEHHVDPLSFFQRRQADTLAVLQQTALRTPWPSRNARLPAVVNEAM
jgi:hypothetical protein